MAGCLLRVVDNAESRYHKTIDMLGQLIACKIILVLVVMNNNAQSIIVQGVIYNSVYSKLMWKVADLCAQSNGWASNNNRTTYRYTDNSLMLTFVFNVKHTDVRSIIVNLATQVLKLHQKAGRRSTTHLAVAQVFFLMLNNKDGFSLSYIKQT